MIAVVDLLMITSLVERTFDSPLECLCCSFVDFWSLGRSEGDSGYWQGALFSLVGY